MLYELFLGSLPTTYLKEPPKVPEAFKFAVISDPQLFNEAQVKNKENAISTVLAENDKTSINFCLFPGDLTSHGWNNLLLNKTWQKIFFPKDEIENKVELGTFVKKFIRPLEIANIPTYSVMGNHDTYTGPILSSKLWIRKKHGSVKYMVSLNDNVNLYGLHIYPDKKVLGWLKKNLDPTKYSIMFFHYPPIGPMSSWWDDSEKEDFWESIKDHKDKILAICVGHSHNSGLLKWKGIDIVNAGGDKVAFLDVDLRAEEKVKIEFK
jgi:Icc-related predicted phosphoesterase